MSEVLATWIAIGLTLLANLGLHFYRNGQVDTQIKDLSEWRDRHNSYHKQHFDHAGDHGLHTTRGTMSTQELDSRFDMIEKMFEMHAAEDRRVQSQIQADLADIRQSNKAIHEDLGKFYELIRQGRLT